jgi:hypothetical protein
VNEYRTLKPVKVIVRKGRVKRENNGGEEPNQYGNVTTKLPVHYYILITYKKQKTQNEFRSA